MKTFQLEICGLKIFTFTIDENEEVKEIHHLGNAASYPVGFSQWNDAEVEENSHHEF